MKIEHRTHRRIGYILVEISTVLIAKLLLMKCHECQVLNVELYKRLITRFLIFIKIKL